MADPSITGTATAEGTAGFFDSRSAAAAPSLPAGKRLPEGLLNSDLGWGTNSGEVKNIVDMKYESALPLVLEAGVNLIDTSPSYRCRRSQAALGRSLKRLTARGAVRREELVISTQAGFVAFDRKEGDLEEFLKDSILPETGLAEADFLGSAWSMHPDWIRNQFELARRLTGLEAFDILLLGSPDMGLRVWSREDWRVKLRTAFGAMEELRGEGRILCYGLATQDGFRTLEGGGTLLDLDEILSCARSAGGAEHGFRVIQLPYSLGMLDYLNAVDRQGRLLKDELDKHSIFVMATLCLGQGQLAEGLPPAVEAAFPGLRSDAQRALQFCRSTPGLGCTLVGMKTREHLRENLELLAREPAAEAQWRSLFSA